MSPRKIVICDDHQIVRGALRSIMDSEEDLEVVGEAVDGKEVLGVVEELDPDLLIMDVELPKSDGISALERVLSTKPGIRVLVFSAHEEPELIELAAEAGATGFVGKSQSTSAIVPAARRILAGDTCFPAVSRDREDDEQTDELHRLRSLTPREREILDLFATGMRARGVAERVGIRPATVYTHVRNAIHKLSVDSRTQAVAIATRYSFLDKNPSGEAPPSSETVRTPQS